MWNDRLCSMLMPWNPYYTYLDNNFQVADMHRLLSLLAVSCSYRRLALFQERQQNLLYTLQ
jgi:hypothetical protein